MFKLTLSVYREPEHEGTMWLGNVLLTVETKEADRPVVREFETSFAGESRAEVFGKAMSFVTEKVTS